MSDMIDKTHGGKEDTDTTAADIDDEEKKDLTELNKYIQIASKYYKKLESSLIEIEKNKYQLLLLEKNKRNQVLKPMKKRERSIEKKKFMRRKGTK